MEMERLVRCVSTLVYVCMCPLGLLGAGSSSVLLFLSATWDPSCSVCPGLELLGSTQGGYSNDTLHHTLHKTAVNPRHKKAIGEY